MQSFIFLNGKIFSIADRDCIEFEIGSGVQRTLSGKARKVIFAIKKKWTFTFNINGTNLIRLYNIYNTNTNISFIDWDDQPYTVLWSNEWNPKPIDKENQWYTLQVNLEQI